MSEDTEPLNPPLLRRIFLTPLTRAVMVFRSNVKYRKTKFEDNEWRDETDEEMS